MTMQSHKPKKSTRPPRRATLPVRKKEVEIPNKTFLGHIVAWNDRLTDRYQAFLGRRPHRSFHQTRRRDYKRDLVLPGYAAFAYEVNQTLKRHWKTFGLLIGLYTGLIIALGGITSQDTYTQINDLLRSSGKDVFGAGMGQIGQAGLLALSAFATGPGNLSVDQQIYLGISLIFAWLTTVWLLREYLVGRSPRLRDGLYTSGAPFLSTCIVLAVLVVQFIPVGLVALIYAGLYAVGILDGGLGNMIFWLFAIAVATLSLYWATSTVLALVIVTLPGMYPFRALRAASDIVVGRRLRLWYRLLFGIVIGLLAWAIVMIPLILLDAWLASVFPSLQNVPIVPYVGALMIAITVVWIAAYVYLLYRKVVDDNVKST